MALAFVKSAKGTSALSTVSWAFGTATTSGNLIVGAFASDDYNGTPTTGWTQSSEMEQQTFHGAYIWWRISTGETNLQAYTIGSATNSAWVVAEFSGNDSSPYDTSQGLFAQSSGSTLATDTITPSAGQRLLVAMGGGSKSGDNSQAYSAWNNSFTAIDNNGTNAAGTNDCCGLSYRIVTGDGSTTFSTTADYTATQQARSALIISFKEAAGGGGADHPASKRFGGVPGMAFPGRGNVWAPYRRLIWPGHRILRPA